MSRYRKLEVKTWSDEKFRKLSPLPPSGQSLWLFLMAGPFTGPIPGLFRAGRAAMAEELGWEQEAFDKAFDEVLSLGMVKADFKARLVWLPNALKHNRPESPNVVRGWRTELDVLPECDLKAMAIEAIEAQVSALGEGFAKAAKEALYRGENATVDSKAKTSAELSGKTSPKPSAKPSPKTMANQEQEQEQDKYNPKPPAGGARDRHSSTELPGFAAFWGSWPASKRKGAKSKCFGVWSNGRLETVTNEILAHVEVLKRSEDWTKQGGQFVPAPLVYLNQRRWEGADLADASDTGRARLWEHAV